MLGALVALSGCGGGGESVQPPGDAGVVRAWTEAVRERDYDAATELFAVPATIANGAPAAQLESREAIEAFNRSLPCGAFVTGTEELSGGYLRVDFRLTRGPGCGGADAEVTFRIVDGHITEWLREAVGPPPGTTEI